MHRYIAFIANPRDHRGLLELDRVEAELTSTPGWTLAYRGNGALVAYQPTGQCTRLVHPLAHSLGVVLGTLFSRVNSDSKCREVENIEDADTRLIIASSGRHLVQHFWGSYVAIVRAPDAGLFSVLRDPTANLACFHVKWHNTHVFFSDIQDLTRYAPIPTSIDWHYIAARLIRGYTLSRECALERVQDVPGGEWITLSAEGETRATLWHPAQFCLDNPIEDQQLAAYELRSTVLHTVRTLASQHAHVMVELSGGLDSSIITACLADQREHSFATCLNFYISNDGREVQKVPSPPGLSHENRAKLRRTTGCGDEREFARSVAQRYGFRFIEKEKRVRHLDPRRIWQAPLAPRPSAYVFAMDDDDAECECAAESRATACFTGHAGDTVFYATLRAIGALDYAYLHPLGLDMFRQIRITAAGSGESMARVIGKVVKYGLFRNHLPMPLDPMKQPHLLTEETAAEVCPNGLHHPWVESLSRLCPGKENHVLGVAYSVPFYYNIYRRERIAPSVHPLASQPVVELCLRIPTYVLLADGISRGLARQAFRDLLPPEIVDRTTKGTSAAFWQRFVRHNMALLRECLLDGALVRHGLLDRRKLDRYLVQEQPFLTVSPTRIMDYLACETWLHQWPSA